MTSRCCYCITWRPESPQKTLRRQEATILRFLEERKPRQIGVRQRNARVFKLGHFFPFTVEEAARHRAAQGVSMSGRGCRRTRCPTPAAHRVALRADRTDADGALRQQALVPQAVATNPLLRRRAQITLVVGRPATRRVRPAAHAPAQHPGPARGVSGRGASGEGSRPTVHRNSRRLVKLPQRQADR